MTARHRPRVLLAVLTAAVLLGLLVPAVDARIPHARHYRVGGAITLDTNLLSKSGASAWAIDQYLRSTTSLPPLGQAFIKAEQKYGVNARFLLAAAMHESAWGTSFISRVKHNLFGYNAYDRDPFRYASAYATYAANINATAKFIKDFYLTRSGRWWGGAPTLRSMQQFWSSSHTWGVNVSRIATSIHLATIRGKSLKFQTPVVEGRLHGGDRATVKLSWAGGSIPAKVEFVATWVPVVLDADAIAAAASTNDVAVDGLPSSDPSAAEKAPAPAVRRPTTTAARRTHNGKRSVTLTVAAPRQAGSYLLEIQMRDIGRRPLPAAQQVVIPTAEVRVWGDRSVSIDIRPSADGTGAVVRVTNTGRKTIPAAIIPDPSTPAEPGAQGARSVLTVTGTSSNTAHPASVLLLSSPLAADLRPGASATFDVPGVAAATGRASNWVSASLQVAGDPAWLAAYSPVGAWVADPGDGMAAQVDATQAAPALFAGTPPIVATPVATAAPSPTPTAAPAATRAPKPAATPAPRHVTRVYSERSSAIRYRGAWGSAAGGGYLGGAVTWSRTAGSSATFTFTGTSVSWVGPLGPTRGLARVLIDGHPVATVNLWRSSFTARVVLFHRSFRTAAKHSLTITVLSAPGHPYVAIDGFVIRT